MTLRLRSANLARSVGYLAGDLSAGLYGLLVLGFLLLVALLSVVGVGLLLTGLVAQLLHQWCDHERARTGRFLGRRIGSPHLGAGTTGRGRLLGGAGARALTALVLRLVVGIPLGVVAIVLPLMALNALAIPLYWWAMPDGRPADQLFAVTSWWDAAASGLLGLAGLAVWATGAPAASAADGRLAEQLLAPSREEELQLRARIEEQRRRSASDAHTAELRRIERDLHDAAQNRLVAVSMFVGTAQRQLSTGVGDAAVTLEKAQAASRDALAEMRRIIRGIYPPTLAEEGLIPALGLLVDRMQIPTRLHVETPAPTPASVDAALYFSIAESLTNVGKHSSATGCDVHLRWEDTDGEMRVIATVTDNGRGGADPSRGSGLAGLEGRIGALGGTVSIVSPPGGPTSVRMELPCES